MSEKNESREPVTAGSECSAGLGAIIGKWPGNETDEEIMEALEGLNPEKRLRGEAEEQNRLWLQSERELDIARAHIRALAESLVNEANEGESGPSMLESSARVLNEARAYLGMKPWGSA